MKTTLLIDGLPMCGFTGTEIPSIVVSDIKDSYYKYFSKEIAENRPFNLIEKYTLWHLIKDGVLYLLEHPKSVFVTLDVKP